MKRYIVFIFLSIFHFVESAEQTRLQLLKNEGLIQQGRASEGIYFQDDRAKYNGVEMMSADNIKQFNQNLSAYNNEVLIANMPLLAESESGKSEILQQAQLYSQRYANKVDLEQNKTILFL